MLVLMVVVHVYMLLLLLRLRRLLLLLLLLLLLTYQRGSGKIQQLVLLWQLLLHWTMTMSLRQHQLKLPAQHTLQKILLLRLGFLLLRLGLQQCIGKH